MLRIAFLVTLFVSFLAVANPTSNLNVNEVLSLRVETKNRLNEIRELLRDLADYCERDEARLLLHLTTLEDKRLIQQLNHPGMTLLLQQVQSPASQAIIAELQKKIKNLNNHYLGN